MSEECFAIAGLPFMDPSLWSAVGHCLAFLLAYLIPAVTVVIPIRVFTRMPSFVFRKVLHLVAFTCVTLMIPAAQSWQAAALTAVLIALLLYPVLWLLEKKEWYSRLLVEKTPGEIKRSLLLLFFMFAGLIAVSWGIFQEPCLGAGAILMWGTGDGAAALVGIPFGRHKIRLPFTDGKKSWEGSTAMLLVSTLSGAVFLGFFGRAAFSQVVPAALLGTLTELYSPSEYDTVTVPLAILAALLIG